jgi:solute carrier family 25 phosphate transporter 23/24/25/41
VCVMHNRLQAQAFHSPNRYTGMADCFLRTLKREGIKGFYKGLLPNLLKVAPAASITYVVYEKMKKTLAIN